VTLPRNDNELIRRALARAVASERKRAPFRFSGRGHEPRVTLDRNSLRSYATATCRAYTYLVMEPTTTTQLGFSDGAADDSLQKEQAQNSVLAELCLLARTFISTEDSQVRNI